MPYRSLRRRTASSFLFSAREIANGQGDTSAFGRNIRISRTNVWTARCSGCVNIVRYYQGFEGFSKAYVLPLPSLAGSRIKVV